MKAKLTVLKTSLESLHELSTGLLSKSERSKALPKVYKDRLKEISLVSVAALNHLYEVEKELV